MGRIIRGCTGAVLGLALITVGVTGCGPDRNDAVGPDVPRGQAPPGGTAVNGIEREWTVLADLDHVRAGPVRFTFKNSGTLTHEMLVVRTNLPLGRLAVDPETRKFDEESDEWEVVGEISEYEVGKTGDITLDLESGNYQLVCNIPGHYASGMAFAFRVD